MTVPKPCSSSKWKKLGIVLQPFYKWEGNHIQNFTCSVQPLGDDQWRIWYSGIANEKGGYSIAIAEGAIGEKFLRYRADLIGDDNQNPLVVFGIPQGWHPVQPVHIQLNNGTHRLYFWAHAPGIVRFLAAESRDGRVYSVLNANEPCLYHPNDRAAILSEESRILGLTPSQGSNIHIRPDFEKPAPSHLISNDATNVYQMPDGTFELYTVGLVKVGKGQKGFVGHDIAAGWVRVVDRLTSADGLHWENRSRVLAPDAGDPDDMQFYFLSVTYTKQGRVGLLGHYRVEAQTMDIEWCFSHDGLDWHRPYRRGWLERGFDGEPDCYGIYAPHSIVKHGGKWWLFYTGTNQSHNHKHSFGPPQTCIMLAQTDNIWND